MTLNQLQYFVTVSKYQNITKAAQHQSAPTAMEQNEEPDV